MRRHSRPAKKTAPTADNRTPASRLSAFIAEPGPERKSRMFSRIRQDVDDTPGPWIQAARALHVSGDIDTDVYWYLATIFVEAIVYRLSAVDPDLVRISDEMVAIEAAHGLSEFESFLVSKGPREWRELSAAWDRRSLALKVAYLRAHDADDVARAMEVDHELVAQRAEAGRQQFWPEEAEPSPFFPPQHLQ